jgi:pimeloyl-ACP methyl ester carboxylesterase
MTSLYRTALGALCLSLILPCATSAMAQDDAAKPAEAPAPSREPLAERSVEDALALERQLPAQEQQQLQAGSDNFLALWKPANSDEPAGAVILVPGAGENADWPQAIGPLRRKFPDVGWATLSLSLPDPQGDAPQARPAEKPPAPVTTDSSATPPDAGASVEKATAPDADNGTSGADPQDPDVVDSERIFARIEAGIAFAQQHKARSIALVGHGTGAYWATRYVAERQSPHVQKLVLLAAKTPGDAPQSIEQLIPGLKVPTADIYYKGRQPAQAAAQQRLQASKRQKGAPYSQVALQVLPDKAAQEEQLFRRVRGWLSPVDAQKADF